MKKTALYQIHQNLGAKIIPFAGFEMPVSYSGIKEEHLAVRKDVGLFDVSHMGEFLLKGKDAEALLQWICSNDISKINIKQCQYNCFPNENGGIVDDLIVYKMAEAEYILVVNASNIDKDFAWMEKQIKAKGFEVDLKDISAENSIIAVQGPKAKELIQKLTTVELDAIKFYWFEKGIVAGIENVIISSTGYTGSGGFELYVGNKDAEKLWEALMDAGAEFNVKPCGLAARDTLRLEMGYVLYGNDIDDTTSPIEAGLSWITKFSKDFVHAEFHKNVKENLQKKLVAFELLEKGIPRQGYEVADVSGEIIGRVTSGTQAPSLNKAIGLAYVNIEHSALDSTIYILVRNKSIPAKVVKTPFK